jgi:hypothetical protein
MAKTSVRILSVSAVIWLRGCATRKQNQDGIFFGVNYKGTEETAMEQRHLEANF